MRHYEGLAPDFDHGRLPKLTGDQKEQVKGRLKEKSKWLTSEVKALNRQEFNADYSFHHLARMLRGFGIHYAKPYLQDHRRPEDAEQLLKQAIAEALEFRRARFLFVYFINHEYNVQHTIWELVTLNSCFFLKLF